jgi:hypothetical protein
VIRLLEILNPERVARLIDDAPALHQNQDVKERSARALNYSVRTDRGGDESTG